MTRRLLVTVRALQRDIERFRPRFEKAGVEVSCPPVEQAFGADDMVRLLRDADVAIVGDDDLGAPVLAASRHVKLVVKWGVGMDAIDLGAARELGVRVVNTPHALPPVVAEGAIGYLLCVARQLPAMDRAVREGRWEKPRGTSLLGKTMGIVGMGRIGQELATRAHGLGMGVVATDVRPDARLRVAGNDVAPRPLDEVLALADVLVLCCNLTAENARMINAASIARMKQGALLVNVARGRLVDTDALVEALRSGRLGGAALDVFEDEPLPAGHPLARLPNVFLGSHNVQNTHEAVAATNEQAVDLALEALADG